MTLKELGVYWFETFASRSLEWTTVNRYEVNWRRYIEPAYGHKRLLEIKPAAVESWVRSLNLDHGLCEKSANGCLMLLKKILSDAVRWQFISHNPIAGVRAMKEVERDFDFWTSGDAERFLAGVRNVLPDLYYAAGIALYSGMRLGEIQALKWDAVDFTTRLVTVKRTFCLKRQEAKERTKTNRIRRLPINKSLLEMLLELKNRGLTSDYVLPTFSYHHASRLVRLYAEKVGVKPIRFHDLRHSFASNFVMSGGQIYKLQRLLGHTSIQMTERYSHLSPDHLTDATELLDFGTRKIENVVSFRGQQNAG
jgi:integrase